MAEKDITQKILEAHNDVFADLANGFLFKGKQLIKPEELQDIFAISAYEDRSQLHFMERDVSKLWKHGAINIACIGVENQTKKDLNMPLRILAYDGSEYKKQVDKKVKNLYPVITLVLYFGKSKWNKPKSLLDRINVIPELKPFVSNYKINIFDITHMTSKETALFHNDFKVVVDYFSQINETGIYKPTKHKLNHPGDTFRLMKYLTGNKKFETVLESEKGGSDNMYDAFADAEQRGKELGEARMGQLLQKLFALGRIDDAKRVAQDVNYRAQLMKEFAIQ